MIPFYVGQKVICVNDELIHPLNKPDTGKKVDQLLDGIKKGEIYTIREIGEYLHAYQGAYIGIRVEEIVRNYQGKDTPFHHTRFRPIVKTDISVFQSILNSITSKRLEDA